MQNLIEGISATVDTVQQINKEGMTSMVAILMVAACAVVPIILHNLFKILRIHKELNTLIDSRIELKIGDSIELLKDTVRVVKSLEKNTAEISATLSILKEIMLSHKSIDKSE